MRDFQFRFRFFAIALVLAACAICAGEPAVVVNSFELPPTSLQKMGQQAFSTADLAQARANGLKHDDLPSLGSGLARIGTNEFVGLSDRGPNGEVHGRRTFPLPKFCPFICRFKFVDGRIEIVNTLLIKDSQGRPLTGLSNGEGEERLFESGSASVPLPFDPNGIDPEAIRVLPDGKFLISEEYGPSILVVNTNGQVVVRYAPETKLLPGTTYPVRPILPAVLTQRRTNRGFEALALSPDGRVAYAILQSPMGDENDPKFRDARVSRVLRLDISDPLNARVTGQFLLPLSRAVDYSPNQKQSGVKLNDAEWLAPDKLLVLEQAGNSARLMVVDLTKADNFQTWPDGNTLGFEATKGDLSVRPALVEMWATISDLGSAAAKLEGLAILSATEVAVANDNDFGLVENGNRAPSTVWKLRLARPLPLTH